MQKSMLSPLVASLLLAMVGMVRAEGSPDNPPQPYWYRDYGEAMRVAEDTQQMLVVFFSRADEPSERKKQLFAEADTQPFLNGHVLVKVSKDEEVSVDGQPTRLLEHDSFHELQGRAGLAMIDLRDPDSDVYRQVVSVFPFHVRNLDRQQLKTLLTLPEGTLTQRTLIFAVQTHPERPRSASTEAHEVLAEEAELHSRHQAQIGVLGHHRWNLRSSRIIGRVGGFGASEVCAQSWAGQGLFAAAIECVNSWRQSPNHWSAVQRRHRYFGYDMKRGRDGVWYATGLFVEN